MVRLSDLVNRQYVNKECWAFDYLSPEREYVDSLKVSFQRVDERTWQMVCTVFLGTPGDEPGALSTHVYTYSYQMPRKNLPLDYVASQGLLGLYQMLSEDYSSTSVWAQELWSYVQGD